VPGINIYAFFARLFVLYLRRPQNRKLPAPVPMRAAIGMTGQFGQFRAAGLWLPLLTPMEYRLACKSGRLAKIVATSGSWLNCPIREPSLSRRILQICNKVTGVAPKTATFVAVRFRLVVCLQLSHIL
jgi:hypothetical protein